MAWTNPKTWTAATLTAADLNTHVRDNLKETAPAIVTTLGDLVIADAVNSLVRLGIGSNGQVLTADSAQASGWKWAARPTTVGTIIAFPAGYDQFTYSAGTPDQVSGEAGAGIAMSASANAAATYNMVAPGNFGTFVDATLYIFPTTAPSGGNVAYNCSATAYDPNGTSQSSDSISTTTQSFSGVSATEIATLDVSAAFDGLTISPYSLLGFIYARGGGLGSDTETAVTYTGMLVIRYTEA